MENILKKINKKIDNLIKDKSVSTEIKSELDKIYRDFSAEDDLNDQLRQISTKLESIENENKSLKDFMNNFSLSYNDISKFSDRAGTLEKAEKLDEFLKKLADKVNEIITVQNSTNIADAVFDNEEIFSGLKKELTVFQVELESKMENNFSGLGDSIKDVIIKLGEKIVELYKAIDERSESQLYDFLSELRELKTGIATVSDNINRMNAEFALSSEIKTDKIINVTKNSEQNVIGEITSLSDIVAKSSFVDEKIKETISVLKDEITALKGHVFEQINEVLSNLSVQEDIKHLSEETISEINDSKNETETIKNHLRALKLEDERQYALYTDIKNILAELSDYELNDNSDKIDIIYENLSLLNNWIASSDKMSAEFKELLKKNEINNTKIEEINDKLSLLNKFVETSNTLPVVYQQEKSENISNEDISDNFKKDNLLENLSNTSVLLNNKISVISDKISEKFKDLAGKCNCNSDKLDIIYENLSFLNTLTSASDKMSNDFDELLKKYEFSNERISSLCDSSKKMQEIFDISGKMASNFKEISDKITEVSQVLVAQISGNVTNLSDKTDINSDKLDIIYENLSLLNDWASSSDKLSSDISVLLEKYDLNNEKIAQLMDNLSQLKEQSENSDRFSMNLAELSDKLSEQFNELSEKNDINNDKLDIIYENLSFLNDWASSSDKLSSDINVLLEKYDLNNEKIDILTDNLLKLKEQSENSDRFSTSLAELSDKISDKISEVSQDLAYEISGNLTDLSDKTDINNDKLDIIYENLSFLNDWASASDKLSQDFSELLKKYDLSNEKVGLLLQSINKIQENSDISEKLNKIYENTVLLEDIAKSSANLMELREELELNNDKTDIIYENLSYLNEWVQTLNKLSENVDEMKEQCVYNVPQKVHEIYDNILVVKDLSKKADALSLQLKALSVQISETESTVNPQNLSDMKKIFIQMNEDMSNVSARTNKLILDSDKQNEKINGCMDNLHSAIAILEKKSKDFGFEKMFSFVETVQKLALKRSGFESGMTESFVYLAEWIDKAGSLLNSVKQELTLLDDLRIEQSVQVQRVTKLFDMQEQQMSSIFNIQNILEEQTEIINAIAHRQIQQDDFIKDIHAKQMAQKQEVLSYKITEDYALLQLEQEYVIGQLQKLILQNDEQKEDYEINSKNIVNQIQQIFDSYSSQLSKIEKSQKQTEEQVNSLTSLLEQYINSDSEAQRELSSAIGQILTKQDAIYTNKSDLQTFEKSSNEENSINISADSDVFNIIQNSYAEINENLHTIAELIEQNEKNSQMRALQLSCRNLDGDSEAINSDSSEIKALLNHIAKQNDLLAEKSAETDMLSKKIISMEEKISSFEQYMAKLIDYLEED